MLHGREKSIKDLFNLGDGGIAGLGTRGGMCRSLETLRAAAASPLLVAQFSAMPIDGIQQLVLRTC